MKANELVMTKMLKDAFHELYDDHEQLNVVTAFLHAEWCKL